MSKRIIYVIDSSLSSNLYSYLCLNLPKGLMGEFVNNVHDLESFELFYFNHKDEVYFKSFYADRTLISFIIFFSSLFKEEGEALTILNQILENIYASHPVEQNQAVLSELNEDALLPYFEEILTELKGRDNELKYRMEAKCNDLISSLANIGQFECTPVLRSEKVLLDLGYRQIVQTIHDWMLDGDEPDIEICGNFNWTYELSDDEDQNVTLQWASLGQKLNVLDEILSSISTILYRASYAYSEFSKDDKNDFMNLWILLVISGYQSILPLNFFEALKRLLPNTF